MDEIIDSHDPNILLRLSFSDGAMQPEMAGKDRRRLFLEGTA